MSDAVDSALDSEEMEDEIDEEVDKVLTAIAGETSAQLPDAVRREKLKQPAVSSSAARQVRSPFFFFFSVRTILRFAF